MKKENEKTIGIICALLVCLSSVLFVCWLLKSVEGKNLQIKDELAFCKSINGHYGERKCFKDGVVVEYKK